LGIAAILAFRTRRLRTGDPQDRKVGSELLEVTVGGHQDGPVQDSQGGCDAVDIGNFVECLEFTSLKRLQKIDSDDLERKARQIRNRLSRLLLTTALPQQVENFSPIKEPRSKPKPDYARPIATVAPPSRILAQPRRDPTVRWRRGRRSWSSCRPVLLYSVLTFPGLNQRILAFQASDKTVDELVRDGLKNQVILFTIDA
jgi:hypothetical protein